MTKLVRWNPRLEVESMARDPFFRRVFDWFDDSESEDRAWYPALDLVEESDRIIVTVELPGVDIKDIDVNLQGNLLTVKGERKCEREEKEQRYHRREQVYGTFQRAVRLPCNVDAEKVEAAAKNGVLKIKLPKAAEHVGRNIPISAK